MPPAERARQVLAVAQEAVEAIRTDRPAGNQWVILWAGTVALLRAVGHALNKVDAASDQRLRVAVDEAWERWNADKSRHAIFWEFIDNVRNSILKEFDLKAGQGVAVQPGGDHTVSYPLYLEGFDDKDQIEVLDAALEWWRAELEKIETSASTH